MKVGKFYEYSLFGIRYFFATVVYETACIISLLRDAVKNLFEVRIYLGLNRIIILRYKVRTSFSKHDLLYLHYSKYILFLNYIYISNQ